MIDPMQEMDETDSFTEALRTFRDPSIKGDPALMKPQDNASSFFSATDVMLSVPRGVVGAAKGVYNLADLLTFDLLPDWDKNPLGESTSTVGGFVETISEFAVGFLSGSAAISAVSKAGKLGKAAKAAKWLEGPKVVQKMAKGAVAGGVADFTVFEGDEMRLSNLVESIPGLNNPITEFLAAKEDDVDSLTGRLKNVIEGAIIGTAVEGAMRGVGSAYRMARGVAAAADVVKQTRLASQSGMSAEEVFRVREAAMEKNKQWLEDVPAATDEYLAQSERRFVEEDAVAQDLKANQPGADRTLQPVLLDSIGPLTPDQIKGLDPSIPRAADGTIDAQALRKELVRLREEGNVNLVPALNDQGVDAAALRLDNYLKTGGVPEPRQTISQADQVAAVEGRRIDLPTDPVEVSKTIDELDAAGAAMHVELSARINDKLAQLDEALKAGDNQSVAAAADALRVLEDLDKKLGSGQGRALQRRNNGNIAELVARSPQEAELLGTLLDGVSSVTIVSPKTLFGRFTDAMFKVGKTGLDVSLELFRNSILSGPRTTSINTLGNLGGMFVNQGELAAGAWLSGKLLGRNRATNINTIATQEGQVLVGYLDQVFDAFGLLVGRSPRGGVSAATGRPIALANAAESWRREGMGVTLADRAWSEGIEPPRGIDAQRMGLGQTSNSVDNMGRQVFEPSPFGHVVNVLGKVVNIPLRVMGMVDEWFSTSIARTNARMFAMRELGDSILKMTPDQIDAHVDGVLKNLFDESGRLYSRKAVEERAIKQAVKEGLNPTETKGKARILSLVQKGDDAIGFEAYDAKMGRLAKQIEDRVRGATWKKDIDDLINDPLRGAGTALVGNLGKSAQSLVRNIPAAGLILPFIRTPTNLIAWALNRNPASLVWKGIQNDWYKANPARQAELMGRLTTGVALYSAGITLATMGVLTGRGPRDPALRQQLRESGWQPYSIKVGDKYVSFARADPFSTIIGFIADLTDVAHKMEEGEIEGLTEVGSSLIGAMTAVITDKTFISGLTGMLNAVTRPDLYGEQLVKQYASAFVPNFFAQSLTPFSAELEKSRSALDAMMMRIPGWGDESVDRLRNPLGEAMLRDKGPLGNATDVVNPFSITTAKDDPVNNEFINLGRAISSPRRTLSGGIDLWDFRNSKGQTAYDRYQELTSEVRVGNRNLRSRLVSLIQSRQYQSLASGDVEGIESPRAGVLRSEIGRYRKKAFEQLLQEFPDLRLRYMQSNEVRAGMRR